MGKSHTKGQKHHEDHDNRSDTQFFHRFLLMVLRRLICRDFPSAAHIRLPSPAEHSKYTNTHNRTPPLREKQVVNGTPNGWRSRRRAGTLGILGRGQRGIKPCRCCLEWWRASLGSGESQAGALTSLSVTGTMLA